MHISQIIVHFFTNDITLQGLIKEQYEMARLGSLRIWGLKRKCIEYRSNYKAMRERIKELEERVCECEKEKRK